ncbi:MAG: hypothetical protein MZV49_13015 [Rhodopseudomonas palustris]|nr:hypothetical protein [Rhodopseudomonas palustris]
MAGGEATVELPDARRWPAHASTFTGGKATGSDADAHKMTATKNGDITTVRIGAVGGLLHPGRIRVRRLIHRRQCEPLPGTKIDSQQNLGVTSSHQGRDPHGHLEVIDWSSSAAGNGGGGQRGQSPSRQAPAGGHGPRRCSIAWTATWTARS